MVIAILTVTTFFFCFRERERELHGPKKRGPKPKNLVMKVQVFFFFYAPPQGGAAASEIIFKILTSGLETMTSLHELNLQLC